VCESLDVSQRHPGRYQRHPQGVRVAGSRCARIPLRRLRGRVVAPCPRWRLLWLSGFLDPRRRLLVRVALHFSYSVCASDLMVVAVLQRFMSPRLTDHPMADLPHRRGPTKAVLTGSAPGRRVSLSLVPELLVRELALGPVGTGSPSFFLSDLLVDGLLFASQSSSTESESARPWKFRGPWRPRSSSE
jgi:hypothetical protein